MMNIERVELVLVVKGSMLPIWFLEWLKAKTPNAKWVHYMWDNISTDPKALEISSYFDRNYSFSPEDCVKYGYRFRPFFF